jgi:cytochrome c-type biogenesis protein CcmH
MKQMIFALIVICALPAFAVQPDEILDNPQLEQRARDISSGLRCVVCRNESIDESNAELARDLRLLVRERLLAGDSNDQVFAYIVERYGEYVLLRPTREGSNRFLWNMPFYFLGLGIFIALPYILLRGQMKPSQGEDQLTQDEQARLDKILGAQRTAPDRLP